MRQLYPWLDAGFPNYILYKVAELVTKGYLPPFFFSPCRERQVFEEGSYCGLDNAEGYEGSGPMQARAEQFPGRPQELPGTV